MGLQIELMDWLLFISGTMFLKLAIPLSMAACAGLLVFLFFRRTGSKLAFDSGFGASLFVITLLSAGAVMCASQTFAVIGVVLSLAVLYCFRVPGRNLLHVLFLCWAVGAGVGVALGRPWATLAGSLLFGLLIQLWPGKKFRQDICCISVACKNQRAVEEAVEFLSAATESCVIKRRALHPDHIAVCFEVVLREGDDTFLKGLYHVDGVVSAMRIQCA